MVTVFMVTTFLATDEIYCYHKFLVTHSDFPAMITFLLFA
jgi:hypothetical protein